jgi:TonB family protein
VAATSAGRAAFTAELIVKRDGAPPQIWKTAMRFLFCSLLAIGFPGTQALAKEPTFFQKQLIAYVAAHPIGFPAELRSERLPIDVLLKFSLDRDGKLLNPRVEKGTGIPKVDQDLLAWLAKLQPFPMVSADDEALQGIQLPVRFGARPPAQTYEESERRIKQMIGNVCKGC